MKPVSVCIITSCLATLLSLAALPPRSPEDLDKSAELIIRGTVVSAEVSTEGKFNHTNWVAVLDVRIDEVVKGDKKATDSLEIHCWRLKKRPHGWVGASGHYSIPAVGSSFKMWLRKSDEGKWTPLAPNGIQLSAGEAPLDFQSYEKPPIVAAIAATAVSGILIGAAIALMRKRKPADTDA